MITTEVGTSGLADSRKAGREAAYAATPVTLTDVCAAIVFSGAEHDCAGLVKGVREALPGVPFIGSTAYAGVATGSGFVGGKRFAGVLALAGDAEVGAACVGMSRGRRSRALGRELAVLAMKDAGRDDAPDFFYLAATPGEEEGILLGLSDVIGRVPCFGGGASGKAGSAAGSWVFSQFGAVSDGAAVLFIYGAAFASVFDSGFKETGDIGIITEAASRRRLARIDGVAALLRYSEWLGVGVEELAGAKIASRAVLAPLGVKERTGGLTAVNRPLFGYGDLSIKTAADIVENTAVIRLEASAESLAEVIPAAVLDIKRSFRGMRVKQDGEAARLQGLVILCGAGVFNALNGRLDGVIDAMAAAAGGAPFILAFTASEIGFRLDGANCCGGLMVSAGGIG